MHGPAPVDRVPRYRAAAFAVRRAHTGADAVERPVRQTGNAAASVNAPANGGSHAAPSQARPAAPVTPAGELARWIPAASREMSSGADVGAGAITRCCCGAFTDDDSQPSSATVGTAVPNEPRNRREQAGDHEGAVLVLWLLGFAFRGAADDGLGKAAGELFGGAEKRPLPSKAPTGDLVGLWPGWPRWT